MPRARDGSIRSGQPGAISSPVWCAQPHTVTGAQMADCTRSMVPVVTPQLTRTNIFLSTAKRWGMQSFRASFFPRCPCRIAALILEQMGAEVDRALYFRGSRLRNIHTQNDHRSAPIVPRLLMMGPKRVVQQQSFVWTRYPSLYLSSDGRFPTGSAETPIRFSIVLSGSMWSPSGCCLWPWPPQYAPHSPIDIPLHWLVPPTDPWQSTPRTGPPGRQAPGVRRSGGGAPLPPTRLRPKGLCTES